MRILPFFIESPEDSRKDNCYISKLKYNKNNKIGVTDIHFSNLHPIKEKRTDSARFKDITNILPMSICCWLVNSVAAPIPKNTWEEAIQKFAQYFLSSLIRRELINDNVSNELSLYNGQMDDVKVFNYALTDAQVRDLYNAGSVRFSPLTGAP